MEICAQSDLEKLTGSDDQGEYYCPHCRGTLYCIDESKSGDPVYQCQQCLIEMIVLP